MCGYNVRVYICMLLKLEQVQWKRNSDFYFPITEWTYKNSTYAESYMRHEGHILIIELSKSISIYRVFGCYEAKYRVLRTGDISFQVNRFSFPARIVGGRNKRDAGESRGYLSTIAQTEIRMKLTFTGGNSIAAIYAVTSSPLLWHTDSLYKIQSFHFRGRKFDNSNRYVNTDPDTRRPICSLCSTLKAQMLTRLSIKLSQIRLQT